VIHDRPVRPGPRARACLVALLTAAATLVASTVPATPVAAARGDGVAVSLDGPARVGRGDALVLTLTARGVPGVAGYQATLRFDPRALEFGGTQQRGLGLAAGGRAVEGLGPVFRRGEVTVGAWSCGARDCVTRQGLGAVPVARGEVLLARLWFAVRRPAGVRDVTLEDVRLVDGRGGSIAVAGFDTAPRGGSRGGGRGALDMTADGLTTHADAMEASVAWQRALEANAPCGARAAASDVTGDGCLTVEDVVSVAARFSPSGARRGDRGERRDARRTGGRRTPRLSAGGGAFIVDSTGDERDANPGDLVCATAGGACTLRAAIEEANLAFGPDTIAFAIPGDGLRRITVTSTLPSLTDETGGTLIDGTTQPGARVNDAALGSNAALRIEVTPATLLDGLTLTSAGNEIRGLALTGFRRAISIVGAGATGNVVAGSFVGLDAAGTTVPSSFVNNANGVSITQGAAANRIGLPTLAGRNVISGNAHNGVFLYDEGTERNLIVNNVIGLSPDGSAARRNIGRGVDINGAASFTRVGGDDPIERNVVSGNVSEGIEVSHFRLTVANRVVGNRVGTDLSGEAGPGYAANGWAGIHVEDGATETVVRDNVVGNSGCGNFSGGITIENGADGTIVRDNRVGITADGNAIPNCNWGIVVRTGATRSVIGPGNVIASNPVGIEVYGASTDGNTITRNRILGNTGAGITLGTGANDDRTAPVLVSATVSEVTGTACGGCTVEVFAADTSGSAGPQGRAFLGRSGVAPDGTFVVDVSADAPTGRVTATATDRDGDTSRFSPAIAVADGPPLPGSPATLASDTFTRAVGPGWGLADQGGTWGALGSGGTDAWTDGGIALQRVPKAGNSRGQGLSGVVARDVDVSLRVRADRPAQGATQFVYVVVRRDGDGEYRARIRFAPGGTASIRATRVTGGAATDLGRETAVSLAGGWVRLRAQVTGSNPTSIRIKAWDAADPEPLAWQWLGTDDAAPLQDAGALGVRTYLSGGTTNAPVTFSIDDLVATEPRSSGSPAPAPEPPTEVALDGFERTVADTWGRADAGGVWSVSGSPGDYDVEGGVGLMLLPRPGTTRIASLASIEATDLDLAFRVHTDDAITGNVYAYAVARRLGARNAYRLKLRIAANGKAYIQATRFVEGAETGLGPEVRVPGVIVRPGVEIAVRAQAVGTSPTTLRIRAWEATAAEPTTWQAQVTDGTAVLQGPGGVGLRGFVSGSATAPVTLSFDDFRVMVP
jgi:CSLREA domain-containing protein